MKVRYLFVVCILLVTWGAIASVSAQGDVALGPVTQNVLARGELICGVNAQLAGFGVVNDAGEFEGL